MTFVNSLDSDQARHNVGPDLNPNCLTLWLYYRKNILKILILKKKQSAEDKNESKITQRAKC